MVPRPIPDLQEGHPNRRGPPGGTPTSPGPHRVSTDTSRTTPRLPDPDIPRGCSDPSRTSPRVSQLVPNLSEGPRPVLDLHEGPLIRPGNPRRSPNPSRTSPRVPRLILGLPKGPLTRSGPPRGSPDPSRTSPRVPTRPGHPRGFSDPSQTSPRVSSPVLNLPEGPRLVSKLHEGTPTRPEPPQAFLD